MLSTITKKQLILLNNASKNTKFPLTEKEIIEVAIQAYYNGFRKDFPELFPKDYDPIHTKFFI